jgi:peptidyl-prolyl isomerase E (cyclophilin E)
MEPKRIVYVGGLEDSVDEKVVHAAFIPFGPIVEVQLPSAQGGKEEKNRGFAFVEFEEVEDAAAAIDTMDASELLGRVLRVNLAKPAKNKLGSNKAVWAEADDWYKALPEEGAAAPVPSMVPSRQ